MKKLYFLIICIMGLSILSCSTENDDIGGNGGPNNNLSGKLLKKATTVSEVGDQNTNEFFYNNEGKILQIILLDDDGSETSFSVSYDNGRIASVLLEYSFSAFQRLNYHYDDSGKLWKVVTLNEEEMETGYRLFTWSGSRVESVKHFSPEDVLQSSVHFTYYPNGNLQSSIAESGNESYTTVINSYDANPNPYKNVPELNIIGLSSGGVVPPALNNPLSYTVSGNNDNNSTYTATYTYDAEGYPISATQSGGSTTTYEYY